jgi:hypothetical protein
VTIQNPDFHHHPRMQENHKLILDIGSEVDQFQLTLPLQAEAVLFKGF